MTAHRSFLPRLAAAAALVMVLGACMLPDNQPRISIEFGMIPELEGATVLVDGRPVGKLERTGQATRIAFPVSKGVHEVTIRDSRFACEPIKVKCELDAQKIRLMAEIADRVGTDGSIRQMIVLR